MVFSNTHKALLITLCISASILLMAYNFDIKKQNDLVAETYYELLPEDTEDIETPESLDDILKSFDDLTTNKAFNEHKDYNNFEDDDFKETMEKLNSRHEKTLETPITSDYESSTNNSSSSNFENINSIIEKVSASETDNKKSSISFSLVGREKVQIPPPIYLCEASGKIVISITVDSNGNVIDAQYNNASNSNNGCLIDHALEYAKASTFSSNPNKKTQLGTITFLFRGK